MRKQVEHSFVDEALESYRDELSALCTYQYDALLPLLKKRWEKERILFAEWSPGVGHLTNWIIGENSRAHGLLRQSVVFVVQGFKGVLLSLYFPIHWFILCLSDRRKGAQVSLTCASVLMHS